MPLGPLKLITPPTAYPVTLDEAKQHCRIDGSDDDALIRQKLQVATEYVEQDIEGNRQLIHATYDVQVVGWWEGQLQLPRPPLSSVTSVKYYDTLGVEQTLATTIYLVKTPWKAPGTIERAPDQDWPELQTDRLHPVTIRFVAGYGTGPTAVPQKLRQAVLLATGWFYEDREPLERELMAIRSLLGSESYGFYG